MAGKCAYHAAGSIPLDDARSPGAVIGDGAVQVANRAQRSLSSERAELAVLLGIGTGLAVWNVPSQEVVARPGLPPDPR